MNRGVCIAVMACATLFGAAQEVVFRPVSSAWSLEAGTSHLADTYLSPVKYSGQHYGIVYSRLQALKGSPEAFVNGLEFGVSFDRAKNRAGNSTMYEARIDASWRLMRRWQLGNGFSVGAGGVAGLEAGALALGRNGNNPVQARASIAVGAEAYARWNGRLGRLPIGACLQASTPLLGAFFCPDYGELYYEIALGNHSGLAHFGWPGNRRRLRGLASVDLKFGSAALRLGYRLDATSARANGITARRVEHSAVVGIVCDYISLNPHKPLKDAKIISADY